MTVLEESMLRAVRDWFDNMDRKIDNAAQTMLSGGLTPDQSSSTAHNYPTILSRLQR